MATTGPRRQPYEALAHRKQRIKEADNAKHYNGNDEIASFARTRLAASTQALDLLLYESTLRAFLAPSRYLFPSTQTLDSLLLLLLFSVSFSSL